MKKPYGIVVTMEEVLLVSMWLLVMAFLLHDADSSYTFRPRKLVSYALPDKRPLKKSLGFYEDTYLNFTELTSKYGYETEEHRVTTEDGYILTVFRILPKCDAARRYPVILMHGINDSSDHWILAGPETGFAYVLVRNCYDVWAANHRGNVYSRLHTKLDPDSDPEYWNFSFDENGNYDLPALFDYVLSTTKTPKVIFIGHSQGTTDFFVMTSLRPEYNQKVQLSIQIAPIAWMKNLKSPLAVLLAPQTGELRTLLTNIGIEELFAKHHLEHFLVEFVCQFHPEDVCGTALTLLTGYKRGNISPNTLAVTFGHWLVSISVKDVAHYAQLIVSGKFQRFDEGREGNIERYGVPVPPEYDVSKVIAPVVLICGENDLLSTSKDVDTLASRLPNVLEKYVVPDPSWSHNDHIFGINAPKYVFPKILEYLDRYS